MSQGVFSANSLVLTAFAAWQLDLTSFGRFGVMFATFALAGSVHDAFVGEARAVLDVKHPGLRGALFWAQLALVGTAVAVTAIVALLAGFSERAVIVGALAGGAWVAEAGVRRVLSARLAFGSLIVNDLVFLAGAIGTIVAFGAFREVDLTVVLAGWALGATASVGVGLAQMTMLERDVGRVDRASVVVLVSFGTWRVLQSTLRPLALLAIRLLVLFAISEAAVAEIELARIVAAPISTATAGISQFLLPRMAIEPDRAGVLMRRAAAWLGGSTIVYGAVAVALVASYGGRLTGVATELEPGAVAAWVLVGLAMSLGLPAMNRLIVARRTREVFVVRLVDNVVGLGLAAVLIAVAPSGLAPAGVGISGILAAFWLDRSARRIDRRPAEVAR